MHYLGLLMMAEDKIAENPDSATDSVEDRLILTMPEPRTHNGDRVRLFRHRGPVARIINGKKGRLTVSVSARRVRDYLNGLVAKSEMIPGDACD